MRSASRRKGCGFIVVLVILVGILLGYSLWGSSIVSSNSTPVVDGEIDTSKYVKLSMFLIGPSSPETIMDYKDSIAQLNASLKNSINTNVEITFVPFDEVGREYPLVFNSKETYDVTYTSAGANPSYFRLVEQENFKDLDELLPIYAKNIWESISPDIWDDIRYKDKIYGIPLGGEKYRANSYIYRGDLLDKYEMDPLLSMEDMEKFMDTLLKEEADLTPVGMNEDNAIRLYDMLIDLNPDWIPAPGLPQSSLYLVSKPKDNVSNILYPVFSNEFIEFAEEMKDWAEKGYWQEEVLTEDSNVPEGLDSRNGASLFGDLSGYSHGSAEEQFKFFCFGEKNQKVIKESAAKNLLGINAKSHNGERALMMLDFIMKDRESYEFFTYGIQGQIFKGTEPGDMLDYYESISIKDPYAKFTFDFTPVEQEIQNIVRVNSQYGVPILLGKAGDPTVAVNKYREELKAAGIQKVIDAVRDQFKDFSFVY